MNFKNYLNRITGNNNIYTRTGMMGMTLKELLEREKELGYQYRNIGIPEDEDLELSPDVESYSDNTGKRFWRSIIPGQKNIFEGGVEMNVSPYDLVQNNQNLSQEDKVSKIKEISAERNRQINKENVLGHLKNFGGAALQIGSAFVPGALGKNAAAKISEKLAPGLGRKIAGEIVSGLSKGTASGAVEGLGRGISNNENILKTTVQDSALGAIGGAALGAAGGKVQQFLKGKKLKNYGDIDMLESGKRSQYNKDAKNYYQDYIQGRDIEKDGKINFTGRGIQELLRWNPKLGQELPELINDIKKAAKLPDMPNMKPKQKPNTQKFEVYRGKQGEHLIDVQKDGQRRYYTTKDISPDSSRNGEEGLSLNPDNITENNNHLVENILKLLKYIR